MTIALTIAFIFGIVIGIMSDYIIIQPFNETVGDKKMTQKICPCCGQVIPEPPPSVDVLTVTLKPNNEGTKVPEGILCTRTPTVTAIVTGNNNLPITYFWSWIEGSTGTYREPSTNNVSTIPVMGPIYANSILTCKVTSNGQTVSITQKVL